MGEEGPGGIPGGRWDRCGVEAGKGCTGVMATVVVSGPGAVRDVAESRGGKSERHELGAEPNTEDHEGEQKGSTDWQGRCRWRVTVSAFNGAGKQGWRRERNQLTEGPEASNHVSSKCFI